MVAVALVIVIFAVTCCVLALWVIVGDHDLRRPQAVVRDDGLAGMSPDALEVVRRANRSLR